MANTANTAGANAGASEFLNPKSMLTPGAAGGVTFAIATSVGNIVPLEPALIALIISFVVGVLVFAGPGIALAKRIVLYVLNSLIIFVSAAGLNTMATQQGLERGSAQTTGTDHAAIGFIAPALAQQNPTATTTVSPSVNIDCNSPKNPPEQAYCDALRAQNNQTASGGNSAQKQDTGQFFTPWFKF